MDTRETKSEAHLSSVDIDVLLQILDLVQIKDILSVRKCSKHFNTVSRLRTVWHNALIRHVLENDIPIPRSLDSLVGRGSFGDFSDLSSEALETVVLAALYSSACWRKLVPKRTLTSYTKSKLGRVFFLKFIDFKSPLKSARGRNHIEDNEGRFILTAGYSEDSILCLQVWDLESKHRDSRMQLVGEWTESGRLFGLAIDDPYGCQNITYDKQQYDSEGIFIALSVRSTSGLDYAYTIRILRFSPPTLQGSASSSGMKLIKSIQVTTSARVEAFSGCRLVVRMGVDHNIGVVKVINWIDCPSTVGAPEEDCTSMLELTTSQYGVERTVLDVQFIHDWVLVFREPVVEFYFLPSWLISLRDSNLPNSIQPACLHKWAWNINSLSVSQRVSWIHDRKASKCTICSSHGIIPFDTGSNQTAHLVCACRYRPLSIVIRFDSYFPWPVNLIHHYVLPLQEFYDPTALVNQALSRNAPNSSPPPDLGEVLSPAYNSPFLTPPLQEHTISSAVRLFARSDLVMCRFGTLVWLDSEADSLPQSSISLRLVDPEGRCLASPPAPRDEEGAAEFEGGPPSGGAYADGTGERIAGRHLSLPGSLSAARAEADTAHMESAVSRAMEKTIGQSYGGSMAVTTLFGSRQWEGWYAVAANERAGRVVVGDKEGGIEVWDHF